VAVTGVRACEIAHLPGLSMRRLADLHPGSGKTDTRDGYVMADAARTLPHLLHSIDPGERVRAEPIMVRGHDSDLARDATRTSNRLRRLLTSIRPARERVPGPRLRHPAVLALLQTYRSPTQPARAGTEQNAEVMTDVAPRMRVHRPTPQIQATLAEPRVQVPGTGSAGETVSGLAKALAVLLESREILEMGVAALLEARPLAKGLTSVPRVAVRTGARILAEVGDAGAFPISAHLASYAGLTPTTRRSGTSVRGEGPPRGGDKMLERALFLASFASPSSIESRTCYDTKRAEKKRHNAALICLTRRIDVLHAMLKRRTLGQLRHEPTA
jgi:hypothetical protein